MNDRLTADIHGFARQHILTCKGLGLRKTFPGDIWAAMGRADLLDPERLDQKFPCAGITAGARALAETGGNLGMALAWMIHMMTARFLIRPHLNCMADDRLWDLIRSGETTVAFAVSEPGAGAHPKFMSAAAQKGAGTWALSGEKAYLSNGPIAGWFVVVAITGQQAGIKAFSAFLVKKGAPGLSGCTAMDLRFLRPATHGSLMMDDLILGEDRLLGREGAAFDTMVLPFRQIEDAAMAGAAAGAMGFILSRAAIGIREAGAPDSHVVEQAGDLAATVQAAVFLSDRMACMVDQNAGPLDSLGLHFRQTTARFLSGMEELLGVCDIRLSGRAAVAMADLGALAKIGAGAAKIKKQKLGRRLLDQRCF